MWPADRERRTTQPLCLRPQESGEKGHRCGAATPGKQAAAEEKQAKAARREGGRERRREEERGDGAGTAPPLGIECV